MGPGVRILEEPRPHTDTLSYEPLFGLDEKPFSLNADQRFIYSSPSYEATRGGLLAGLRRREGLHVLTGEIGTGKTTLCQDVLRELGRKTYSAIVPDPFASREDLLKMLLIDFGAMSVQALTTGALRQASRTELGYMLSQFLDSLTPDTHVVVVIDEAQNLTLPLIEETRILSDTFGASGRLQIVFIGQPELHAKLKLPEMRQVDQRVCGYHRLGPMSREAVAGYIAHRLHAAGGCRDRVLFPPEIVNRLHSRSGGVPRLINRVCDRALHLAYEQRAEQVDRVTLEAALSEIGSATLSPTWDAIVFAESPAQAVAAPAPVAATVPVIEPTVAQAVPAVETPAPIPVGEDFNKQIDQWVAKDLAPPVRAPLSNLLFGDEDVLPPPPPPERRSAPRTSSRGYVSSRTITNESPRQAMPNPRAWVKRIATAVGVLVAATVVLVGAAVMTVTEEEAVAVPTAIAEGPAPAEPAVAQAEPPAAVTPSSDAPVAEAPVAPVVAPVAAAAVMTAPIAAAISDEYLVAVGLFSSRARADQLVDTLTQAGLPALQRPFQLRSRELQQIVLGPFFTRAEAAADLQRLKALGGYGDARVVTN